MKYDLIIFDCDGTLVDSEPVTNRLISMMMAERGIQMTPDACLEEFAGKNIMYITSYMERFIGQFDHIRFEEEYRERCLTIFDEELEEIPGVRGILESVRVAKCVASNGPRRKMDVTLRVTGLQAFFNSKHIFSAYDIQKWKPDPHLFLHAAHQMNVHPDRTLIVEDTISGVQGALNAKMDVVAYNPKHESNLQVEGVLSFESMLEISAYLESQGVY
jgi:HAD superfamily hydrolase (TIGR01509 family)